MKTKIKKKEVFTSSSSRPSRTKKPSKKYFDSVFETYDEDAEETNSTSEEMQRYNTPNLVTIDYQSIKYSASDNNLSNQSNENLSKFKNEGNSSNNIIEIVSDNDMPSTSGTSKRKREQLDNLTPEQKYLRIREQNNRASKKCREKKKQGVNSMAQEIPALEKLNAQLRNKVQELEKLKSAMEKTCQLALDYMKHNNNNGKT